MSLQKNTIANYVGQGWVAFASLAFVPVYVDRLGVESYGLIGFYAVLQSWFSLLDLGMTPTITRETARFAAGSRTSESIGGLVRSMEVVVFTLAAAIATGIWFASGPIATRWLRSETLPQEAIAGALAIISLVVAARFCEGIYRGVLFGLDRQVFYNGAFAVLSTIRYAGAAVLVTFLPSIEAFFLWQALLSIVTVLVFGLAAYAALPRSARRHRFSLDALRGVGKFAGGMSVTALFALLFTQVDKVILTRLVDLESFGLYMLALALAGIFPMLASPAASAFFPRLSVAVASGDREAERELFHTGIQIVSIVTVPAVTLCMIMGNEIVFGWTGDAELAAKVAPILGLVAIGAFSNAVLQIPFMLQLAHGWTTLSVRINLLGVVVLAPTVYFGTSAYGLVGAAAAWAITNVIVLSLATFALHRRHLKDDLVRFLLHTIASPVVACSLAIWLMTQILPDQGYTQPESIGVVVLSGSLALLIAMVVLPLGRRTLRSLAVRFGSKVAHTTQKIRNQKI